MINGGIVGGLWGYRGGGGGGGGGGLTLSEVEAAIRATVPQWSRQPQLQDSDIPDTVFRDDELTNVAVRRVLNLTQADLNDIFTNAQIRSGNLVFTQLDDTEISLQLATGTPSAAVGTLSDPRLTGTILSFMVAGNSARTEIDLAALAGSVSNEEGLIFVPDARITYPTASSFNDIRAAVTGAATTYTEGDGYRFFMEGANDGVVRFRVGNAPYAPVLRQDLTAFVGGELKLHHLLEVTYNSDIGSWISNIDTPQASSTPTPIPDPTEYHIRYGLLNSAKSSLIDIRRATLLSPPNSVDLIFPAPTAAAPYWFVEIPNGLAFSKMINIALHEADTSSDWTVETVGNSETDSEVRGYEDTIVGVTGRFRLEVTVTESEAL